MNERVFEILNFCFTEYTLKDFFKKNDNFDKQIKNRFCEDYNKAINNELDDWQDEPEHCLSLIILLDQFSRNLFRDDPRAYKQDYKARLLTNESIDRGDLEKLNTNQALFLLLPLIHSEDISDHIFANKLAEIYLKKHPDFKIIIKSWSEHTHVIKRFNRYPHRNEILKRNSTNSEINFLKDSSISF